MATARDQEIALGPPIRYYGRISYKWTRMCSNLTYTNMVSYDKVPVTWVTMIAHLSQEELYQLHINFYDVVLHGIHHPQVSTMFMAGIETINPYGA